MKIFHSLFQLITPYAIQRRALPIDKRYAAMTPGSVNPNINTPRFQNYTIQDHAPDLSSLYFAYRLTVLVFS